MICAVWPPGGFGDNKIDPDGPLGRNVGGLLLCLHANLQSQCHLCGLPLEIGRLDAKDPANSAVGRNELVRSVGVLCEVGVKAVPARVRAGELRLREQACRYHFYPNVVDDFHVAQLAIEIFVRGARPSPAAQGYRWAE